MDVASEIPKLRHHVTVKKIKSSLPKNAQSIYTFLLPAFDSKGRPISPSLFDETDFSSVRLLTNGLHPRSLFNTWTDFVIALCYCGVIWTVPFMICFDFYDYGLLPNFRLALSIVFAFDTFVALVTPQPSNFNPLGSFREYEMTRPTLRVWFGEYVTSQLAIDVISLVPFDIVFWNPRLRMLGIFRLVRLVRLPRIFQRCAIFRQAQNKIEEIIGIGASKTLPIAFCIFCFMHFNACATYYTAKLSGFVGWESVWPQFAGASTVQVYTWTMFQAVGNLFPMSFKPQTTAEQVVAICFIIAGAILYAAFVGYISSAAVSVNPSGRLYNQKMEELIDYVKWKKLSPTTRDKLVSYYEIKYRGKYFEEESLLADMNESLREEVSSHNTRRLIEKVVFLRRCEGDGRDDIFFNKMSTVLHARYYIPGDYVTKQGDSGNDMFFILSGKVNVSVNGVKVVSLYDEAYFGEVSLITKSLRTATVQAGMASILYRLTRQDFQSVISEFEDMQERILELAEEGQRLVPQPKQASRWDVQT